VGEGSGKEVTQSWRVRTEGLAKAWDSLTVEEIATMAANLEGTQMMEELRLPDSTDVTRYD